MTQSKVETTKATDTIGVQAGLHRQGKLSYLQIPAVDVRESGAFYERVFDWKVNGGSDSHFSFEDPTGELIGAWVTGRAISGEPGLLPYIYVDRIDQTMAKIAANGGQVVRAPYHEGDLWVATFRDPAGNVIGVWQRRLER
jgi:predicted enzyme related to lactoylglutathione lyase